MKSIQTQIKKHIDSVTAVLVLANGTVPRVTVGTDYALTTLSAIFPRTLASNVAFIFTNVSSPLHGNSPQDNIPELVKHVPQFLLDSPIVLQKRYPDRDEKKVRVEMRNDAKIGEQRALEMLEKLFDWMDGLKPHPTTEIAWLYELSQRIEATTTNILALVDQVAAKKAEIDKLMVTLQNISKVSSLPCSYSRLNLMLVGHRI